MKAQIVSTDRKEVDVFVQKKTRYAHRDCITWNANGLHHAAVTTAESIKRMMLDCGTQGVRNIARLHDTRGIGHILSYRMALIMFHNAKRGIFSDSRGGY